MFDTPTIRIYSHVMVRRLVAASFVALWLMLLGVEFSEDMGLFDYDEPETDQFVEAALTGLGEAIKISDDLQLAAPCFASANLLAYALLPESREVSLQFIGGKSEFVKANMPIYTLHQVFLI